MWKQEAMKLLEANIGSTLSKISLHNLFFYLLFKGNKTKIKQIDLTRLKSFYTAMETIKKTKIKQSINKNKTYWMGESICKCYI